MKIILIKCPFCKEEMQAPADRETILCMFCGERIDLTKVQETDLKTDKTDADENKKSADAEKSRENLRLALEHTDVVCKDYVEKVREFSKNSYQRLFEEHKKENYDFYTAIMFALDRAAEEELPGIYHQIADSFIREQEKLLGQTPKRNEKLSVQMDKNMFMVIYVLPSIKEIQSDRADALADAICKEWRKSFKDSNINASDFDRIMQGFKRKLCYVTTAVCRNLNKGENCEELQLIKAFRDNYLAVTKEGQDLIEEYYDIAPTLVKRLGKDAGAQAKYLWLWNTYLAPCVEYIKKGEQESCKETYCNMMEVLRKEYMTGK
ncbi:MAG: hypothetical protein HDQ96_07515 [Lachnospiraceae bacterium]|nr:hypothetical protein [Lachnospiraceae bacterium]